MALSALDRIDVVVGEADGERWITVASWPPSEDARSITLFLLKMAMLWRAAARQDKPVRLEVVSADEPPICVIEIAAREDVTMTLRADDRRPARGRPSAYPLGPEGWPDLDALQAANAREFAEQHGLPLPPSIAALDELDAVLQKQREDAGLDEDEESDDALDGNLIVLAGAYAGEAIRATLDAQWVYDLDSEFMKPLHLKVGESQTNLLGKVDKFLRNGPSDSVAALAQMMLARLS